MQGRIEGGGVKELPIELEKGGGMGMDSSDSMHICLHKPHPRPKNPMVAVTGPKWAPLGESVEGKIAPPLK